MSAVNQNWRSLSLAFTNQLLQSFASFFIWFDWFFIFFAAEHVPSCSSARFVFLRWVDMQRPVWSRVFVLSRCLSLLCVEARPTVVLKGVYRGEVECESVTPTALTVTESCKSSGHREHRASVCRLSCLAFHHRPSAQALQEVLRFWLTLNSGFFGNSPRPHLSFSSHFLHSVVNSSVHLAVLIRGEEEENLQILEDWSCFPDSSVFHFCQSSLVHSPGILHCM